MKGIHKYKSLCTRLLLGIMISSLVLAVVFPAIMVQAQEATEAAPPEVKMGKDVYFKIMGPISGPPAPTLSASDYRTTGLPGALNESRLAIWVIAQQHLYFGSFVLAVPIFCMIIEFVGMMIKDPKMGKQYDNLAHDLIRISLTAYSVTAILGGLLLFAIIPPIKVIPIC